ncbi:ADP-forming succinate--CoA ligase subunit beta [Thermomicrobium sp. 4228-Ro]|uniref:ADP-forming succinate--CoA ligase subunit beta n=1 Tax=Thermomicrobium sp. 4228-Ro TaxID=2993937 RepID=UPI002248DB03|nr:ADP-forming succinate--CoA ligase subunit beta [Thermomicrobium sp. 4228-Ro]MCX2727218.1 ADP-forming succinate--CoA ligase subunit beta [Thermomicrobium sp. 4228-Ro]
MDLHEYQAAEIFGRYGIPVNRGIVARTPEEARKAAEQLGGRVVVKAQVHAGGRGKAGGIRLANGAAEAEAVASRILGMEIRGRTVRKVLVAPAIAFDREYYLGVVLDRDARRIVVMASRAGGVDIEEVARERPEAIVREHADPFLGFLDYQARRLAFRLGIEPDLVRGFAAIARQLYQAYVDCDASLAEINPLVLTHDRTWMALDSKMVLDDNGLFRHPDLAELRDPEDEDPLEREARLAGISFVRLDGTVGCIVNGAGLSMATMDAIKLYGGEPANFLDIGGGASAQRVAAALRIVVADPNVRSILVNIFGGITRGDVVAQGLLEALREVEVRVPIVIRLVGTRQEEGRRLLEAAGFTVVETMEEAAERAVAAAKVQ